MNDAQTLLNDPQWHPFSIDTTRDAIRFVRIPREELSQPQFLADRTPTGPQDEAWLPIETVKDAEIEAGPVHFIFHTAFCRSTLLVRALDNPGLAAGLSEPGILATLVNLGIGPGQRGQSLLEPVLRLLARPQGDGEVTVIKPTNHANMLIPALMDARPDSKAVLMTNALDNFLAAVVRKGMMGRRWGRQLYLEMMGYAGMDLGMDAREQFAMTDLQAAGLGWFLNQRYLTTLGSRYGERMRTLDGDAFNAERAQTLEAVAGFFDMPLDGAKAGDIADGPVFASHSKLGGDFKEKEAQDAARASSPLVDEEIAQIGKWIGLIAGQAGLEVPFRKASLIDPLTRRD